MVNFRLVNTMTGDVTTGETFTRRLAFEACAGHILAVLPNHWHVQLVKGETETFDVYRVLDYPKRKKKKVEYRKVFEASIQ